ncbi:MAG TPA: hypothetical protein VF466_00780 [Candidatus Saccharimonadales bacterium]
MSEQLDALLAETHASRVFGDTFAGEDPRAASEWAQTHLGTLAAQTAAETIAMIAPSRSDWSKTAIVQEAQQSTLKTTAFGIALTGGRVQNPDLLVRFGAAVNGMYWGNDQVDGGGPVADATIDAISLLLGTDRARLSGPNHEQSVQARLAALRHIATNIRLFALPEDAPYVVDCFYGQVLGNEVDVQLLSRGYAAAADRSAFLTAHGAKFAEHSTVSAGFPSISSGLYSIYRRQEPLPPLSEVYDSEHMTELLQVSNVFARLLDELGDSPKDGRGLDASGAASNTFVLNAFNQYDPGIVERYCELACIPQDERAAMHEAIANFHGNEAVASRRVIAALCAHIKRFYAELPPDVRAHFKEYIGVAKRVGEISLVNVLGDEALQPKR